MQEYKIEKLSRQDVQSVLKTLVNLSDDKRLKQNVQEHIRHHIAYKMVHGSEMVAFGMAKEFEKHFSLSYFFVSEHARKKPSMLFFFLYIQKKMQGKPIYIYANQNLPQYERYYEATTEDKIYKFKGLREDKAWVALLNP